MSKAFKSLSFPLSGRFGLDPRDDVSEYAFEWEGRTVRIMANPKEEELILVEIELSGQAARKHLENQAALAALHRLNGEAVALRDWRFAIDETDAPFLRANFRAADFEGVGALDSIVADAARNADIVLALVEIAATEINRTSPGASEEITVFRG
jgi:hypothetical protein